VPVPDLSTAEGRFGKGTRGPAVKGGLDLRGGFAEQVEEELVRFLALAAPALFAPLANFCENPPVKTSGAIVPAKRGLEDQHGAKRPPQRGCQRA
jgi:hypothetical protein